MNDVRERLIKCFELVFPDLPESEIPSASQAGVAAWDSVAAITMVNVIEDEFNLQIDLDILAELDSFQRILAYLESEAKAA